MIEQRRITNRVFTHDPRRPSLRQLVLQRVTFLLRASLAAVFFWFGVLKLTNVSPVVEMLNETMPLLARSPFIEMLGLAEMMISVGLVIDRFKNQAATLMIVHLLCTLGVLVLAPSLVFAPSFPVLTIQGEFLVKNLVLIAAGLVVISARERRVW
jgi:uncharacterized membrane protein YkgB